MKKKEDSEQNKKNSKNRKNSDIGFDIYRKIGNNKIICNNKLLLGNKYYHIIISFILITIPAILYIFTMLKIFSSSSITLAIITIVFYIPIITFLFIGACSDPGLVERNNEYAFYDNRKSVIKMNIKGHMANLNYCYTCFHFRPPRTSHCAECDNCVENFDHHCLWLGTCVGKRNYKYFFYLLSLTSVLCFMVVISSVIFLIEFFKNYFKEKDNDILLIIICLCVVGFTALMFLLFFLIKLLFLHTYLVSAGLNFYEFIKKNYLVTLERKPYSRGCLRNIKNRLFKRVPTSKLNLSEINIKEEDLLKSIDKIRSNSILDENDRYKRFPHEENINNLGQSRNEGNNILTATNERQSSLKEKNKNNSNQNSLINSNNANNENSENNDDIRNEHKNGKRSIKSNEVNYEFSNNSLNKNRQNLNDSHFKDNENEEIEKDIEIKNFNVSNMTKTQEDVKSIPNIKHEVEIHKNITNENENNYPKPIKIKRTKEYKGERRSSKETITSRKMLDYINSDIQIVKNELTQKSENLINQDIMDVQKNYITKTHND
jgi:hypothetical protein